MFLNRASIPYTWKSTTSSSLPLSKDSIGPTKFWQIGKRYVECIGFLTELSSCNIVTNTFLCLQTLARPRQGTTPSYLIFLVGTIATMMLMLLMFRRRLLPFSSRSCPVHCKDDVVIDWMLYRFVQ